jgi:hypothetical protein
VLAAARVRKRLLDMERNRRQQVNGIQAFVRENVAEAPKAARHAEAFPDMRQTSASESQIATSATSGWA